MSPSRADAASPATTVVLVVEGLPDEVVARVDPQDPDLGLVDAILRLQLAARRCGGSPPLEHPTGALPRPRRLLGGASCPGLEPEGGGAGGGQPGGDEVGARGEPPPCGL